MVGAFFDEALTVVSFFWPLEYIRFAIHALLGWYTFMLQ